MAELTKTQIEKAALEIAEFLQGEEVFQGVSIYYNGKCMMSGWDYWMYVLKGDEEKEEYSTELSVTIERNVQEYISEADNDTVIAMSFEGDFYEIINENSQPDIKEEFEHIIEKYGLQIYPAGNTQIILA